MVGGRRGAGAQGRRGAGAQGRRGAGAQGRRGAGAQGRSKSSTEPEDCHLSEANDPMPQVLDTPRRVTVTSFKGVLRPCAPASLRLGVPALHPTVARCRCCIFLSSQVSATTPPRRNTIAV